MNLSFDRVVRESVQWYEFPAVRGLCASHGSSKLLTHACVF